MRKDWRKMLAAATALIGMTALAHHAPAIYDLKRERTISGEVLAFEWSQPHTRVSVATTDDQGEAVIWSLEGMSPNYLGVRGWNHSTLKAGDLITVVFHPRKDGTLTGMFLRATLADGTLKVMAIGPEQTAQ